MNICNKCYKSVDEVDKYYMNTSICNKCKVCKFCIKKEKDLCEYCCHKCNRCSKVMLKNNWPEDIIINKKCEKCNHICHDCGKDIQYNKLYYKDIDSKYCNNCFINKFYPKDKLKQSKYSIVSKEEEYGNIFFRWNKTHENVECDNCNKKYWKHIKFKHYTCNKCKKVNTFSKTKDPSTNFEMYNEIIINDKQIWKLSKRRKKCFICYSLLWIDISYIKKGHQYYCNKCE